MMVSFSTLWDVKTPLLKVSIILAIFNSSIMFNNEGSLLFLCEKPEGSAACSL